MDKNRIEGLGHQAKGALKEAAGKLIGNKKLQVEGFTEKVAGKAQNVIGGAKDAIKDAAKKSAPKRTGPSAGRSRSEGPAFKIAQLKGASKAA